MTNKTDVMRGEFEAWAAENGLSLNDRLYGAAVWKAALQSPAVRELVERLEAVLLRDSDAAPSGAPNDCGCSCLSRNAEREYEAGKCPHQLARKALANFTSIKGDKP